MSHTLLLNPHLSPNYRERQSPPKKPAALASGGMELVSCTLLLFPYSRIYAAMHMHLKRAFTILFPVFLSVLHEEAFQLFCLLLLPDMEVQEQFPRVTGGALPAFRSPAQEYGIKPGHLRSLPTPTV